MSGNALKLLIAAARYVIPPSNLLVPTAAWGAGGGVAGGGFDVSGANSLATLAAGVSRTKAKPALRELFLEHHLVTGVDGSRYLVYTSRCRGGVNKVRCWFEGTPVDQFLRSWLTYVDIRGVTRKLYGYVFEIDYTATQALFANGHCKVVAQAFPNDATYQVQTSRVQTVHMRPGAALTAGARYDELKTVGPSGKDFTTLSAALGYAAGSGKTSTIVGIRIDTSGNYLANSATERLSKTITEVFPNTGVTAMVGDYSENIPSGNTVSSVRYRNMLIDTTASKNLTWVFNLGSGIHAGDGVLQFEGCEYTTGNGGASAAANGVQGSGAALTINGDQPGAFFVGNVGGHPDPQIAFKDCYCHDLASYGVSFCIQAINCDIANVSGSCIENIFGVFHGGSIDNCGGPCSGLMDRTTTHLAITFHGAGTPTVYKSALNGASGNLELRINGVADLTINITSAMTQAQLNAAINAAGNPNWTSTAPASNSLAARYISFPAYAPSAGIGTGTDPAAPFTAGVCNLIYATDIHADTFVWTVTARNNIVCEYALITNQKTTASISLYDTARMDMFFCNLAFQDVTQTTAFTSQTGNLTTTGNSHIGFENLTLVGGTQTSIPGGGLYVSNASFNSGGECYTLDCYANSFDGPGDTSLPHVGLITRGPLPTSNTTSSASTGMATESGYINTTTMIPALAGSLLNGAGRYSGALQPTSFITGGNQGWLP